MNCPKCDNRQLAPAEVQGVEVDQCPECGGVWCDAGELARLLSLEAESVESLFSGRPDPATDARVGQCPRDDTRMLRVASARNRNVIVEACPTCKGIWLDGGELRRLLAG